MPVAMATAIAMKGYGRRSEVAGGERGKRGEGRGNVPAASTTGSNISSSSINKLGVIVLLTNTIGFIYGLSSNNNCDKGADVLRSFLSYIFCRKRSLGPESSRPRPPREMPLPRRGESYVPRGVEVPRLGVDVPRALELEGVL